MESQLSLIDSVIKVQNSVHDGLQPLEKHWSFRLFKADVVIIIIIIILKYKKNRIQDKILLCWLAIRRCGAVELTRRLVGLACTCVCVCVWETEDLSQTEAGSRRSQR